MQTEYGYLYLKKNVNVVGVYGAFENLPLDKTQIEITKDFKDFNPNYSYAVVDVKSGVSPFNTVGSLWLYPNGQTVQLYKPANVKAIQKRSGIERSLFPHLLRHTMATDALNRGMNVAEVKEILGHENLDTTMIYAKISHDSVKFNHGRYIV